MKTTALIFSLPLMLVACGGSVQPQDIELAKTLCTSFGGMASVNRYERGMNLTVNCKNGMFLNVRLNEVKP